MDRRHSNLSPVATAAQEERGRAEFLRHVGDALARLYDLPYLQTHPLVELLGLTPRSGTESASRLLQRTLLDVIEALGPSKREAAGRTHRILTLRYLDGVEVSAIQRELAIGRSQYYREQQWALEAVASLLWDRYGPSRGVAVGPATPTPRSRELPKLTVLGGGVVAPPALLPIPITSFVGREREMAEVERLLGSSRLLTLTGPPGVGKTRLALEAAAQVGDKFPDGVYFVPLASLEDPALVIPAIAQALGIRDQGSRAFDESLAGVLRGRAALLVLDNLEQVVEAGPGIARLLQMCPRLRALATSRVRLHVSGEQEFPVLPLELPAVRGGGRGSGRQEPGSEPPCAPAVALFLDRARLVNPDFRPSQESLQSITQICAALDGLPLAIELAAARGNLLAPRDLASRLGSRLDLLTGGPRDLPDRQQTLRTAIAWSYDLLDGSAQVLFERLSVFTGGWTLEAAEAVCSGHESEFVVETSVEVEGLAPGYSPATPVLGSLTALVDNSLVRREVPEQPDSPPRFTMLETVREFARERLAARGQENTVRDRLAEYCLTLAEQAAAFWGAAHRARELKRIARELDNLRSALDWLEPRDAGRALRLTGALGQFWIHHGSHTEGRARLGAALRASGPTHRTLPRSQALIELALLEMLGGDLDAACPLLYEALAIQRELHDLRAVGRSYWTLGRIALRRRETALAGTALIEHGLAIARAVGDQPAITHGLSSLGQALRIAGDPAGARACWEECLDKRNRLFALGEDSVLPLCQLAGLAVDSGDLATAKPLIEEALGIAREMSAAFAVARALELAGALAAAMGTIRTSERALRLTGAAAALRETSGVPLTWYQGEEVQRWLTPAEGLLGERAAEVRDVGRNLTPDEAITEALRPVSDDQRVRPAGSPGERAPAWVGNAPGYRRAARHL